MVFICCLQYINFPYVYEIWCKKSNFKLLRVRLELHCKIELLSIEKVRKSFFFFFFKKNLIFKLSLKCSFGLFLDKKSAFGIAISHTKSTILN